MNLSEYLDLQLQKYVKSLPSYIKDTADTLSHLKKITWYPSYTLVTLDVTSLYSNSPQNKGLEAVKGFLRQDPLMPILQQNFI